MGCFRKRDWNGLRYILWDLFLFLFENQIIERLYSSFSCAFLESVCKGCMRMDFSLWKNQLEIWHGFGFLLSFFSAKIWIRRYPKCLLTSAWNSACVIVWKSLQSIPYTPIIIRILFPFWKYRENINTSISLLLYLKSSIRQIMSVPEPSLIILWKPRRWDCLSSSPETELLRGLCVSTFRGFEKSYKLQSWSFDRILLSINFEAKIKWPPLVLFLIKVANRETYTSSSSRFRLSQISLRAPHAAV